MKRALIVGSFALALGLSGPAIAQEEFVAGGKVLAWPIASRAAFILGAIDVLRVYCPGVLVRNGAIMTQADLGMRERPQGPAWIEVWRAAVELGCISETMQDLDAARRQPAKRFQ
jgi:hypothetical protein